MENLKLQIKDLPTGPGIYKFSDVKGKIIYIGKAKNLKNRVSSYFSSKHTESGRIRLLVSQIRKIDYTVVSAEHEALLLENSLIKKYQPKFNVRLKDGKTYPFIAIRKERFPRVYSSRFLNKKENEYFGPFVSVTNMNLLLDLIYRNFFIRNCNFNLSDENIANKKFRVCLNYHIKLCKGPCEAHQTEEDYNSNIEIVRQILKGKTFYVQAELKKLMQKAAENMEFENANDIKNTIEALKNYESKATVVNPAIDNVDVFSVVSDANVAVVNFLKVVKGAIIQTDTIEYKKILDESDEEILQLAVTEFRERYQSGSKDIILPFLPQLKEKNVKYLVPRQGDKKELLDLARKNAFYYLADIQRKKALNLEEKEQGSKFLQKVKTDLQLERVPRHIECFDNSNIQGAFPVASLVVFKNGKPSKNDYRHFNIKTVKQIDDFASMEEILLRRYSRLLKENSDLPDLVIIDGGKGQLSAAYKSIEKLGIAGKFDIIGIAKKLEDIFKPGESEPLSIDKRSPSLKLIQQARNEAHRFAIGHHRNQRSKGTIKTELENIPGIGDSTVLKLLEHFKSVKKISLASQDEIEKLIGLNRAKIIMEYFSNFVK